MPSDIAVIKTKAKKLKSDVEALLTAFRKDTGYTPKVEVETKYRATNDGTFTYQIVSVTLQVG